MTITSRQFVLFTLGALAGVTACATDAGGSQAAEVTSALELDTGGFDTADEAPEFAATTEFTAAGIEQDLAVTDPLASDPTLAKMAGDPGVARRDVLVAWGKFPPDRAATQLRDWTGQLQISRGGLRVDRAIAFEDRTDHLLPRTSPDVVAFQSVTRPAVDGLVLDVIDPTPAATTSPTLSYTAASGASLTIDLGALADGPVVLDAGDGFAMAAIGARHEDGCRAGFMRGRWHAVTAHAGVYLGVVVGRDGAVVGHVRGIYGERRTGAHVMFGKFIGADGAFLGVLKGTYDAGELHARWLDRAGEHGVLGGKYFEAPVGERGAFLARWAETGCAEDPTPAP